MTTVVVQEVIEIGDDSEEEYEAEEESEKGTENLKIKSEKFQPNTKIDEVIEIGQDSDEEIDTKENISKFLPLQKFADIVIISDSE